MATIFQKDGDDYRRIVTSILTEDNNRCRYIFRRVGHKLYLKAFMWAMPILGKLPTAYDPIYDRYNNQIGILFIGILQDDINQQIAADLKNNFFILSLQLCSCN